MAVTVSETRRGLASNRGHVKITEFFLFLFYFSGSNTYLPLQTLSAFEDISSEKSDQDIHQKVTKDILKELKQILQSTEGQIISHVVS